MRLLAIIKSYAEAERCRIRFQQVFKALAPTRKDRKETIALAVRLLVWHIERGSTLQDIEAMISKGEK